MRALYVSLRLLAIAVFSPILLLCVVAVTLIHPVAAVRYRFRAAVRMWMGLVDWVKDKPVGYTYWERYEAPVMLAEIEVHHEE